MRSHERAPAADRAASRAGEAGDGSGAHAALQREKSTSGVLARASQPRDWAVAGDPLRPFAALGAAALRAEAPGQRGTRFSSERAGESWLCQAGGRLATPLRDGTLLCDEQRTLWVIFGGARFEVPDARTVQRLFAGRAAVHVSNRALAQVGTLPCDGTLLREEDDARVYVMLGGTKHKVSACIDPAHVLWAGALDSIP